MEKAEWLLFRISSEEPKGIFRKQCRDDKDKNRGFAYLDKIICKNTRRKFPTFKRKSGRIALQLAPSLLSFALGPGLLHFKDIHLSTSLVCFFFISVSLPSISSLWPTWFMLGFSNGKVHLFAFLGSWTANKYATKTVARLKGGTREEVPCPAQMNAVTKANTTVWWKWMTISLGQASVASSVAWPCSYRQRKLQLVFSWGAFHPAGGKVMFF